MKTLAITLALISQPVPWTSTTTITLDNGTKDRIVCARETELFVAFDMMTAAGLKWKRRAEVCQEQLLPKAENQTPVVVRSGATFGEVLTWLAVGASIVGAAWIAMEVGR